MNKFKKSLAQMRADEKKAPMDYRKLLSQTKSPEGKRIIKGIINDEKRHLNLLKRLRKN